MEVQLFFELALGSFQVSPRDGDFKVKGGILSLLKEAKTQIFPKAEEGLIWQRPRRGRGRTSLGYVTLSGSQVPHQSRVTRAAPERD